MKYYRYVFADHGRVDCQGLLTCFYEIHDDLSFLRSLEIYDDGVAYSYDLKHAADTFGILPDTEMDTTAASEFGKLTEIKKADFEQFWGETAVSNRGDES